MTTLTRTWPYLIVKLQSAFNLIAGNVKRKACDLYYTSQSIRGKDRKIWDQNFVKGFLHILISLLLSGIQTNRCPSKGNKIAILSWLVALFLVDWVWLCVHKCVHICNFNALVSLHIFTCCLLLNYQSFGIFGDHLSCLLQYLHISNTFNFTTWCLHSYCITPIVKSHLEHRSKAK